jgi:hypothetical protein
MQAHGFCICCLIDAITQGCQKASSTLTWSQKSRIMQNNSSNMWCIPDPQPLEPLLDFSIGYFDMIIKNKDVNQTALPSLCYIHEPTFARRENVESFLGAQAVSWTVVFGR